MDDIDEENFDVKEGPEKIGLNKHEYDLLDSNDNRLRRRKDHIIAQKYDNERKRNISA